MSYTPPRAGPTSTMKTSKGGCCRSKKGQIYGAKRCWISKRTNIKKCLRL